MADDPLLRLLTLHGRVWTSWADATRELAELPVRSLAVLVGSSPAPEPTTADAAALQRALARAEAARINAEALVTEVREAYARLEAELEARAEEARQAQALTLYRLLEPLLTQLPVVRHSMAEGRDVSASDLLALLGPLDAAVGALGLVAIGEVGATVVFDPAFHQASGPEPEPGEAMVVRHVGYRLGDQLLRRARVARPKGASAP